MTGAVKTKAKVRVLLEIPLPDVWGKECQLEQVYKQSTDSALNILRDMCEARGIRIIGNPEPVAILASK